MRQEGLGQMNRTPEINVHDFFHGFVLGIQNARETVDSRIIHHDIGWAHFLLNVFGETLHCRAVSDIESPGFGCVFSNQKQRFLEAC